MHPAVINNNAYHFDLLILFIRKKKSFSLQMLALDKINLIKFSRKNMNIYNRNWMYWYCIISSHICVVTPSSLLGILFPVKIQTNSYF